MPRRATSSDCRRAKKTVTTTPARGWPVVVAVPRRQRWACAVLSLPAQVGRTCAQRISCLLGLDAPSMQSLTLRAMSHRHPRRGEAGCDQCVCPLRRGRPRGDDTRQELSGQCVHGSCGLHWNHGPRSGGNRPRPARLASCLPRHLLALGGDLRPLQDPVPALLLGADGRFEDELGDLPTVRRAQPPAASPDGPYPPARYLAPDSLEVARRPARGATRQHSHPHRYGASEGECHLGTTRLAGTSMPAPVRSCDGQIHGNQGEHCEKGTGPTPRPFLVDSRF
jgi:hypothetical protein